MTDGPTAKPPQGGPSQRALGAMEIAVRRARESGEADARPAPPAQPRPPDPVAPSRDKAADPRPDRWLLTAVGIVGALVVAGTIGLAVSLAEGSGNPVPASSSATTSGQGVPAHPTHHSPPVTAGTHSGSGAGSSTTTTTTTASTLGPAPAGPPVISGLDPSSGVAGQGIEVTGSNFLSSNGQIVASFNGQVTRTSCADQNSCTVTVPPSSGPQSAQVTITTAAGTSNAATFTYG